ncbi:class I SAM-dependent methyltransferase [Ferrimonas pelagia]|uniref:Class I SAM-dependent methyltransferase n=1 Tax=Ferrimonas pelagia TaxID=1177826 RepID=A0ABP9FGJ1_9GAMM
MELLERYYTHFNEDARLGCQHTARLEFDTTLALLRDDMPSSGAVTELGAATGRYSLYYAAQGCQVTAVEPVGSSLLQLKENATALGLSVTCRQACATALPFIADGSQQAVLILGPLYHLKALAQRQAVLAEAYRILKPGGVVAVAYISRLFIAGHLMQRASEAVTPALLDQLYEQGRIDSDQVDPFFRIGYFAKPEEMVSLIGEAGFTVDVHAATDGYSRLMGPTVNLLDEAGYQRWLQYHLRSCQEPSLLGASNHNLVIARKNS